jgi:hypothetical protein
MNLDYFRKIENIINLELKESLDCLARVGEKDELIKAVMGIVGDGSKVFSTI